MLGKINRSRAAAVSLPFFLLLSPVNLPSQTPQREPLGALSAGGEAYLNNAPVTGELTIFVGETLRTGADGAARVSISGRGSVTLASQSQVSFPADARYFAVLERGSVGLRSLEGASHLQLRVGSAVVVPVPEREAAGQIDLADDGSAQVTCAAGSFGVIQLEGPGAAFLNPGEVATILADGRILHGAPTAATAQPPGAPPPSGKRSRKSLFILIGLGGAGAAGAAAALASHGGGTHPPLSPSGM